MQANHIGPREQAVELAVFDAKLALALGREAPRCCVAHVHRKPVSAAYEGLPDRAKPDHAQPLPIDVTCHQWQVVVGLPVAPPHERVVLDDAMGDGKEERHRVVGDGLGVGADRPSKGHAPTLEALSVDAVDADTKVDDAPQRGHAVEQVVIDLLTKRPDPPRPRKIFCRRRRQDRAIEKTHVAALEHLVHQPAG